MAKTKKSNLAYKPTPLWHRNHFEHYARIDFSDASRNVPGVYDFLFDHLQPVLTELGEHSVELRIERLEPLDAVYTNLDVSPSQLKKILERFAKSHQLHHEKNFLSAVVPTKNLSKTLADYNVLFDLFFTDLVVSGKKCTKKSLSRKPITRIRESTISRAQGSRRLLESRPFPLFLESFGGKKSGPGGI